MTLQHRHRLNSAILAGLAALGAIAGVLQTSNASAQKLPPPPHPPVAFDPDVRTWSVPALREWRSAPGTFVLKLGGRIAWRGAVPELATIARELARDLRAQSGLMVSVVNGPGRPGDIVLATDRSDEASEGYHLSVGPIVRIAAATAAGVRHGTQSLLQMMKRGDHTRVPFGEAHDWPSQPRRMMFVDVGRKFYKVAELDDLMRQMAYLKLNTLGLHFNDWPAFRLRSPKFPGLADRLSYDRADIAHLQKTARRYGITIIPEIDFPAHATALIQYRPSLAFKCESMRQSEWLSRSAHERAPSLAWTVDITKRENREFLQSVLREFVPWFDGEYFHIGGDEYQYDADKYRCPELLKATKAKGLRYPGDLFVDWINETNAFMKSLGKKTAIWNWWRFKDDETSIEPDKDILVYAWNSPRLEDIMASGYQVVVTPEDKLYVVPGIENWDGSGYGRFEEDRVYREMPFPRHPQIEGYMLALWADAAETTTDRAMLARGYEPMAIVAERTWAGAASTTLDGFLDRLNQSGSAPRTGPGD